MLKTHRIFYFDKTLIKKTRELGLNPKKDSECVPDGESGKYKSVIKGEKNGTS